MSKILPIAKWAPLGIFGLAFVLRMGLILLHPMPLMSDELDYDELGWTLAQTGDYSADGRPTAYRAIGYPAIVAAVYGVAGRNPVAVKIVQAVCDSLTALLLFSLLVGRDRTAAFCAGVGWALFVPAILFTNQMFSESLFTALLVGFVYVVCKSRAPGMGSSSPPGLVLGFLALIKPTMLLFAGMLPMALSRLRPTRANLALLAWACLPVALWIGRNAIVMKAPVLTTSTGINLLIGNNPKSTGGYSTAHGAGTRRPGGSETAADSAARLEALQYISNHPGHFLFNGPRKVLFLVSSESELAVGAFAKDASDRSVRFSEKVRTVPIWLHVVVSFPSAALLVLGTLGLATRGTDPLGRLFYALLFATAISSFIFFGSSRFRFPLMPFLAMFAAEFVTHWGSRLRAFTVGRIAVAVFACLVYTAVWAGEVYIVYRSASS
jgi:hypothetical protein